MPTDRRTFLLGAAATAVAGLAGCSGDGDDDGPRPPREGEGNGDGTTEGSSDPTEVIIYTPNVAEWEARENAEGNLTLVVDLQSIHPDPTEGTMRILFQTVDGEESYTAPFEAESEGTSTVTTDLPVSYDEYERNMSFPDFTFVNVTER